MRFYSKKNEKSTAVHMQQPESDWSLITGHAICDMEGAYLVDHPSIARGPSRKSKRGCFAMEQWHHAQSDSDISGGPADNVSDSFGMLLIYDVKLTFHLAEVAEVADVPEDMYR